MAKKSGVVTGARVTLALVQSGSATAMEVAEATDNDVGYARRVLRTLTRAGLVATEKQRQIARPPVTYYRVAEDSLGARESSTIHPPEE